MPQGMFQRKNQPWIRFLSKKSAKGLSTEETLATYGGNSYQSSTISLDLLV